MPLAKGARRSDAHKLARTRNAAAHPVIAAVLAAAFAVSGSAGATPPAPQTDKHPINFADPTEDQGRSSACTAHAASIGLGATCRARNASLPFVASPWHFYTCSGAIARQSATLIGDPPPLDDNGRQLADMIKAILVCGVAAMRGPTPDGRNSDVWTSDDTDGNPPGNAAAEPSVQLLEEAADELLGGAHTVDLQAGNALQVCAAALDSGISLYVGFDCGAMYEALHRDQLAQPTPANDPEQGGHCVVVLGYRINAAGQYEWLIRNSWGNGWALPPVNDNADNAPTGCVWATSAWLLACWEVWLLDETLLPAAKAVA